MRADQSSLLWALRMRYLHEQRQALLAAVEGE